MRRLVFVGSHLGFPMDRTPLGGGAMVGRQLARAWAGTGGVELSVVGAGPDSPAEGIEYWRLPLHGHPGDLVGLSELAYGAFCRRFEEETTRWILDRNLDPRETCLVVNDISEGPDVEALAAAGFPVISLWHVDVVDYFNRMYLGRLAAPERLTRLYDSLRRVGAGGLLPGTLRLVFEKQRKTVAHSRLIVVPSSEMGRVIERCYGPLPPGRVRVLPWGAWEEPGAREGAPERAKVLRAHYQLEPETTVLTTLSRISPEKGLHHLIEALALLEGRGAVPGDVCLFVCGEPAFMRGASYMRQVRRAAARLRKMRVFFPGYLAAPDKAAFLSLTNLFISPSVHESYGLSIVEAMAAGAPVLTADHYGVRDWLTDDCGVRVPYGRPDEALAGALAPLLWDRERLAAMGRASAAAAGRMRFSDAAASLLEDSARLLS